MSASNKILIIEDNRNIVFAEKICLESAGYQVFTAEDGSAGLAKAREIQPDLILLDLLLPQMNGYLVLENLQNDVELGKIPVLVTSAKAQTEDLDRTAAYQIGGYLIKPFLPEELLSKITAVLKKKGMVGDGSESSPDYR